MWKDISIVICAYNAEKSILRTLRSIEPLLKQGVNVIVVDDESSDQTNSIVQEFRFAHPTLSLVRISRSGSAGARNTGLKMVSTRYVMFCDSDDEVIASTFESFSLPKSNVDILIFDYELVQSSDNRIQKSLKSQLKKEEESRLSNDAKTALMHEMGFWRYIYKTSFLRENKIRFVGELKEIKADFFVLDDFFFLLAALTCATSYVYFPQRIYRYYSNSTANYERFRMQSSFMGRAAVIQMKELNIVLNTDAKWWFGSIISNQLLSSFKAIYLRSSFLQLPSFVKAIWIANKKYRSYSLIENFGEFSKIVHIIIRKFLLRFLNR